MKIRYDIILFILIMVVIMGSAILKWDYIFYNSLWVAIGFILSQITEIIMMPNKEEEK